MNLIKEIDFSFVNLIFKREKIGEHEVNLSQLLYFEAIKLFVNFFKVFYLVMEYEWKGRGGKKY